MDFEEILLDAYPPSPENNDIHQNFEIEIESNGSISNINYNNEEKELENELKNDENKSKNNNKEKELEKEPKYNNKTSPSRNRYHRDNRDNQDHHHRRRHESTKNSYSENIDNNSRNHPYDKDHNRKNNSKIQHPSVPPPSVPPPNTPPSPLSKSFDKFSLSYPEQIKNNRKIRYVDKNFIIPYEMTLCGKYFGKGYCEYKNNCPFLHYFSSEFLDKYYNDTFFMQNYLKLRIVQIKNNTRPSKYINNVDVDQSIPFEMTLCGKYFGKGYCEYENNCKFLHYFSDEFLDKHYNDTFFMQNYLKINMN